MNAHDKETLAADYVLGTLDASERHDVEQALASDPELAALVESWQRRLVPLLQTVAPVEPPAHVWHGIRSAIGEQPSIATGLEPDRLFERLRFWRWCTIGTGALAAALALYIAIMPVGQVDDGRYVAVLNEGGTTPGWMITVDITTREMTIRPLGEVTVADKSFELWLIEGTEIPPTSLGLLDPGRARTVAVSQSVSNAAIASPVLAVSLEPEGGSPTGLPTGPVVFQGPLLAVPE